MHKHTRARTHTHTNTRDTFPGSHVCGSHALYLCALCCPVQLPPHIAQAMQQQAAARDEARRGPVAVALAVHRCLIYLGDICRYKSQVRVSLFAPPQVRASMYVYVHACVCVGGVCMCACVRAHACS